MSRPHIFALVFLAVAAVQLALPASRIWQYERTLKEGRVFKFRTQPVDPYDAFRGRYVSLQFSAGSADWKGGDDVSRSTEVFVRLETDPEGFAKFGEATLTPPASGDFLKARSLYGASGGKMGIELPFDRFYMEETIALDAEKTYREHTRRGGARDAYALVRVYHGLGVIEQVYIGDKTLAESARAELREGTK